MSEDLRREMIYAGERIKAVAVEINAAREERDNLGTDSEEERRRRIYLTEHVRILTAERAGLVDRHKAISVDFSQSPSKIRGKFKGV